MGLVGLRRGAAGKYSQVQPPNSTVKDVGTTRWQRFSRLSLDEERLFNLQSAKGSGKNGHERWRTDGAHAWVTGTVLDLEEEQEEEEEGGRGMNESTFKRFYQRTN